MRHERFVDGAGVRGRWAASAPWQHVATLLTATVAVAVAASLVLVGTPATAASPSPTPTAGASDPTLVVSPVGHGVVPLGSALTSTIEVSNPTTADLGPLSLTVELSDAPLSTSDQLDEWIDDGELASSTSVLDRPSTSSIVPGDSEIVVSTVAAEALAGRAPGVYALSITYDDVVARSAIVLQGEVPTSAAVGVIVAVTAGPQATGLLTADELTTLTGTEGRLTALLSGVTGTSAVLAVDPSILASIRVLGDAAPATALAWLDRLAALPNERFALQFGDADVSAQADAGLTELLQPTSLDYAMSPADFTSSGTASNPTPTPSQSGGTAGGEGDAALPATPDLLVVPGARAALFWPAQGRADDNALRALSQQPSASGTPATVLSSAAVDRSEQRAAATTADGAPLLVYEAGSSRAVRLTASTPASDAQSASALISAQIALEASNPSGPLVITTERMPEVSAIALRAAIDTVFGYPGIVPATLSTLLGAEGTPAMSTASPDTDAARQLDRLLTGEQSIAEFSSIIDDPTLLTGPERTAILQLLGAGWREDPEGWQDALAAHAEATSATLTSVAIQQPSTVQLVSPEAVLPFFVRNDLPYPVNVVLVSTPDNLRLDVERTTPVRAEPGVNTRVEVGVQARVGSGEVGIELRLLSPTFQQVGPIQRAEVTVRADWERIGIIGLGVIVVLLLGAGFVRTVLRRRRARPAEEPGAEEANADEPLEQSDPESRDE